MDYDVFIFAEKKIDGVYKDVTSEFKESINILSLKDYFKYTLWSSTHNEYMLKPNLIKHTNIEELSLEERDIISKEYDLYDFYGRVYIFKVDDLLNFNYDDLIDVEIDESSIYYDTMVNFCSIETYKSNLNVSYFVSLKILQLYDVDRLIVKFE